jgi:23S rRNA (cytidine1920-2'-O)/16S rRNA (cytidine1409-2'-O)-methyltransferase
MSKKRLDQWILDHYPELTRSKAQSLIEKGKVSVFYQGQWKRELRPGSKYDSQDIQKEKIRIDVDEGTQFVSRAALKLKRAVESFSIPLDGIMALDVGFSTGGFTDYLLQNGARKVLGVDVGRDQLHPSLRKDPRVVYRDKVNAREPLPADLLQSFFLDKPQQKFDLIVIDVSFISLDKIIPNIVSYLHPKGGLITLVKPQFELERSSLNKKGVVKKDSDVERAIEKIIEVLKQSGLEPINQCVSPIEGENGNKEHLIYSHFVGAHRL